jgi:hypothetical protein
MKFLIIVLCVNFVYIYSLTLKQDIMKKITLLAILMVTFITNAQIVLSEDFEGSSLALPTTWGNENLDPLGFADHVWTLDNSGIAYYVDATLQYMYTAAGMSGNYAIFNSDAHGDGAANGALTSPSFDCSALTQVVLTFNEWFTGGYGGAAFVEVSADGGTTWEAVLSYPSTETGLVYGEQIIDITSFVGTSTTAHVRFRYTGDYAYYYAIDNVTVQQPTGSAPGACTTPNPLDEATDVVINQYTSPSTGTTYKWVEVGFAAGTGDAATSYDVTYSLNSDLSGEENLVDTDYVNVDNNGSLWGTTAAEGWQANTTYYWKVTANNTAGSTDSPIWSFTTGAADPLGVDGFTIEALSVSPNPVKDMITINSPVGFDSVEVFNQLGQLVLKSSSDLMNNNRLDLSALNPGMYLMQINADNKSKTVKIIKE